MDNQTTADVSSSTVLETKYLGKQVQHAVEELDLIPWKGGPITVTLHCSEFTSHCPKTGQPDFAEITIQYDPDQYLAETKSVKLFMWQFRDKKEFNEILVDYICRKFAEQISPKYIQVTGKFATRGGICVEAVSEWFQNKG